MQLASQVRPKSPSHAAVVVERGRDELAFMHSSRERRSLRHSTNPLQRLNREIKRCSNVAAIIRNEKDIRWLAVEALVEQADE